MMPALMARTAFRVQERLLGRRTFAILSELEKSQRWPRERLEELRLARLKELVRAAYEHTGYWREVMDRGGFRPEDVRTLDDLRRFPLLEKLTLRERREEMVWRDEGPRVKLVRTSGSTNEALEFYTSSTREASINAARIRGHRWVGIDAGDKEVYFWGTPVELHSQDRIKKVRDWLVNNMLTNGVELSPEKVRANVERWRRWGVRCLFGFPSCFVLAAHMAREAGVDLGVLKRAGLRNIVTTAELLGEANRELIAAEWGVPVYDSFGLREGGLVGHECRERVMHTMDEQLILETIDPVTLEPTAGEGELVLTNLTAPATPMFRYRTGDLVTLSAERCKCGLSLRSLTISGGRMLDFVVTDQGKWVCGVAFIYIMRSVKGIVKFQIRQERPGQVRVLLAVDGRFPADGQEQVRLAVAKRLDSGDQIAVELVDDIQPAPSGKYRPVISKVAEQLRSGGQFAAKS